MALKPQSGVTLLELLVAMVILGVLLSLALPSFSTFLANTRLRAVADNLQAGLQVARMEALKRNEPTVFLLLSGNNWMVNRAYSATANPLVHQNSISATANADACTGGATQSAFDQQLNAQLQPYPIQRSCGEGAGVTVTANFSPSNWVLFDSQGRASATATAPQIDITAADATTSLRILISAGGQLRLCDPGNNTQGDPRNCTT
ncbi:MAG: GspH/FimT family pseudopilin [Rhodocyclaceae bacterium]|nr:GspH/FimT family pseudopilin [Rhodocyclaceae bacterium]